MLSDDQREALRERVIRAYGLGHELLVDVKKPRRKNKRSHSRATQHKREIAAQAIRNYNIHDVLQSGRFPTLSELRYAILEFGYQLEETHDWYVTSNGENK